MKTKSISLFYIPFPDKATASKCSAILVEDRLAACTQTLNATSQFLWNGNSEISDECILIAKTSKSKSKELMNAVLSMHPYELPCIASWRIKVTKKYAHWVKSCVK